jgi:hypothetical protein
VAFSPDKPDGNSKLRHFRSRQCRHPPEEWSPRFVGTIRFFEWRVRAGAEDGTAGRTTDQTTESKNKERVLEAFDTLFNKRDSKAAEKVWSPNYIQRSAHSAPVGEGLFDLVKSSFPTLKYEAGLVGIHCRNAASTPTMRRSFGENGEASAGTQRGLGKRNKRGN